MLSAHLAQLDRKPGKLEKYCLIADRSRAVFTADAALGTGLFTLANYCED